MGIQRTRNHRRGPISTNQNNSGKDAPRLRSETIVPEQRIQVFAGDQPLERPQLRREIQHVQARMDLETGEHPFRQHAADVRFHQARQLVQVACSITDSTQ